MILARNFLVGAAAALPLAGSGGAALAHPHPGGEGSKVERILIIKDSEGGPHRAEAGDRRIRRFELHRGGDLQGCAGGEKIVDESSGGGDTRTKVIVCSKGGDSARSAEHLEEALARISANGELSDGQKTRIVTALRAAIDRARGAR